MSTLWLEFWTEQDDFCIYAETDQYERELTLAGQAGTIMAQFATIYAILEETQRAKVKELEAAIQLLSERLIAPFAEQLRRCDLVRFVVDADLIRCAFDLLLFEERYLFLQRPICYQLVEAEGEDKPQIELGSALLIADLSADPKQACREVAKLFPDAQYAEMSAADLGMIKAAADQVDVLVISAHGEVDEDNQGALTLNDQELRAKLIEKLEAWVVYFDACQQVESKADA